ncbi:uncharacterized protein LOC126175645 [Schistocerca cancellata]|uniref:uncharacterized protein LOC126175645 n=1 Tax=Schistocerca cancellata TaxID=274614 RepID=UPI002118FFC8|nr:uncharacterized protein LOC126175645 [Schistocerca cancellata]
MLAKWKEVFVRDYTWFNRKEDDDDDGGDDLKIYGPRILQPQMNENNLKIFKSHDSSQLMQNTNSDTELKVARFMMYFSFAVLCSKIYFGYRKTFDTWSVKLLSLLSAVWHLAVDLKWFLIPFLTGLLITYVTWVVIYYDSKVPGVQPPSPFSASKTSGRRWHSCYIAAVANGIIFFTILLLLYQ